MRFIFFVLVEDIPQMWCGKKKLICMKYNWSGIFYDKMIALHNEFFVMIGGCLTVKKNHRNFKVRKIGNALKWDKMSLFKTMKRLIINHQRKKSLLNNTEKRIYINLNQRPKTNILSFPMQSYIKTTKIIIKYFPQHTITQVQCIIFQLLVSFIYHFMLYCTT